MSDKEKGPADDSSQNAYYDDTFKEPPAEISLHRDLKARQISMIAVRCSYAGQFRRANEIHDDQLGGAIGTGLIIGSGTALVRGGPLGLFLGYSFVGFVCYLVMIGLGEMATFLPHKKGFAGYATRFVDPALGKLRPAHLKHTC